MNLYINLKVLPTGRGEVKPVDCPTVDGRALAPKKLWQGEAGKARRYLRSSLYLGVSSSHYGVVGLMFK